MSARLYQPVFRIDMQPFSAFGPTGDLTLVACEGFACEALRVLGVHILSARAAMGRAQGGAATTVRQQGTGVLFVVSVHYIPTFDAEHLDGPAIRALSRMSSALAARRHLDRRDSPLSKGEP